MSNGYTQADLDKAVREALEKQKQGPVEESGILRTGLPTGAGGLPGEQNSGTWSLLEQESVFAISMAPPKQKAGEQKTEQKAGEQKAGEPKQPPKKEGK